MVFASSSIVLDIFNLRDLEKTPDDSVDSANDVNIICRVSMFVGRETEFNELSRLSTLKGSSFVVVKGRRRIGKSTLIKEFCRRKRLPVYEFQGLPPGKGITGAHQKKNYQSAVSEYLDVSNIKFLDWPRAFEGLAKLDFKRKSVILLDEISWMAGESETFASELKSAWDRVLKDQKNLMLVVSG
jgi:AAA+ ATPase superfamily predicted ATPase